MSDNTVHNKRTKTLLTDTLLFGISSFGSKILLFLLTPLYTSVLATNEFGVADLINTTINFIYPILTLSISEATLRYAMMKDVSKHNVLSGSMIFVCIGTLALLFLKPVISLIDASLIEYWNVFVITFLLFNIQICFSNFIKGLGLTKLFAIQGILHTAILILCNILFLVVFDLGLDGYLLSIVIGHIIPIIYTFISGKLYKYMFPIKFDRQLIKKMLIYSMPMIPTLLAWFINTSIDKYMIIWFVNMSANGIYSVAHKIPTLLTTVVNIFLQAWQLSAISNSDANDESEYYTKMYGLINVVSLFGCMIIIPLSKPLSAILFDEAYFSAWQCIPMLTISAFFSALSGFVAAAFRAHMKTNGLFSSVAVGALINIALNLLLISKIGIIGASLATALSFCAVWFVRMIMVQRLVRININVVKTIISYALLITGSLAVTFDVYCAYVLFLISAFVIVMLNYSDFATLIGLMYRRGGNIIKKKILKKN